MKLSECKPGDVVTRKIKGLDNKEMVQALIYLGSDNIFAIDSQIAIKLSVSKEEEVVKLYNIWNVALKTYKG